MQKSRFLCLQKQNSEINFCALKCTPGSGEQISQKILEIVFSWFRLVFGLKPMQKSRFLCLQKQNSEINFCALKCTPGSVEQIGQKMSEHFFCHN